jgi:uncharacterized protein YmfQ (DUF2313 family)
VREIGWSHNIVIMERCSDSLEREFYIRMTRKLGWSKNVLVHQIDNQSYEKSLLGQTIVAEDLMITDWIDLSNPTPVQKDFMASLAIADLPHTHFFAFYAAIVDRLVELDSVRLTGV